MKVLIFAIGLQAFTLGCAEVAVPDREPETQARETLIRPETLVGRWRFELSEERRAALYKQLAEKISDPAQLKKAQQDVEEESKASLLEFDRQGVFHSFVLGKEIFSAPYTAKPLGATALLVTQDGKSVTIEFATADTIVLSDPKKGPLRFRRE